MPGFFIGKQGIFVRLQGSAMLRQRLVMRKRHWVHRLLGNHDLIVGALHSCSSLVRWSWVTLRLSI